MNGRCAVIGTGTWGWATAMALARAGGSTVLLWGRDPDKVATLRESREHPKLGTHKLDERVVLSADDHALADCDCLFWAVPTQHSAAIAQRLRGRIDPNAAVVSLSKGLEQVSLRRVSEVLAADLGSQRLGALSGPSHAEEVVAALPAALVAAGEPELTELVVTRLHHPSLRVYHSTDLVGVELGGALKNVVAIAAGICDGLGLGDNTKAALLTRGLAEIRRLGRALGADDATFAGLAGIGDLTATCYSPHGRNRALGLALGRGQDPQEHMTGSGMVAEGAWTCRAAVELGARHDVELPIASQVASVLWHGKEVASAIEDLLTRSSKEENA